VLATPAAVAAPANDSVLADGAGAQPAVTEVKWPEGFRANDAARGQFGELGKKHNLSPAQQQALIDFVHGNQQAEDTALLQAEEKARTERQQSLRKQFGGEGKAWDENLALARKAISQFGSPELSKLLTSDSRFGDDPAVFGFLVNVAKGLGEDAIAGGSSAAAATANPRKQLADALYGAADAQPAAPAQP
jgi:hypothetical protein